MAYAGTITFADGTVLHQWQLTEPSSQLAEMCEREHIDASCEAKAESRRKEILGERLLMKAIFGIATPILHDADRAPYIADSDVHLSVAHTKGLLVVALNHHHSIGVDVEQYHRRVLNVRGGFLNEAECRWLAPDDEMAHIVAWTAKEAIFKTIGKRNLVRNYRDEISLLPFTSPRIGQQIAHKGTFNASDFYLLTTLFDSHLLTFCSPYKL